MIWGWCLWVTSDKGSAHQNLETLSIIRLLIYTFRWSCVKQSPIGLEPLDLTVLEKKGRNGLQDQREPLARVAIVNDVFADDSSVRGDIWCRNFPEHCNLSSQVSCYSQFSRYGYFGTYDKIFGIVIGLMTEPVTAFVDGHLGTAPSRISRFLRESAKWVIYRDMAQHRVWVLKVVAATESDE